MDTGYKTNIGAVSLGEMQLRQIVDLYPTAMPVLDHYGMDMCCGGAHTLSEAARLHGFDPDSVIAQVQEAIRQGQN